MKVVLKLYNSVVTELYIENRGMMMQVNYFMAEVFMVKEMHTV